MSPCPKTSSAGASGLLIPLGERDHTTWDTAHSFSLSAGWGKSPSATIYPTYLPGAEAHLNKGRANGARPETTPDIRRSFRSRYQVR